MKLNFSLDVAAPPEFTNHCKKLAPVEWMQDAHAKQDENARMKMKSMMVVIT